MQFRVGVLAVIGNTRNSWSFTNVGVCRFIRDVAGIHGSITEGDGDGFFPRRRVCRESGDGRGGVRRR